MKGITQIEDYRKEQFSYRMRNNKVSQHDIYTLGKGNKIVVIIQELPGISIDPWCIYNEIQDLGIFSGFASSQSIGTNRLPYIFREKELFISCPYKPEKIYCQ